MGGAISVLSLYACLAYVGTVSHLTGTIMKKGGHRVWSLETGVAETTTYSGLLRRVELNFNQTLRQQQDQAYLESLRADQEKERLRCEERERREGEARQRREKELEEQHHREVCLYRIMNYISVVVNKL
jgi:hypothetical protein